MGSLKQFQNPTDEKITLIMFLSKNVWKIIFMGILILGIVFFKNLLMKKSRLINSLTKINENSGTMGFWLFEIPFWNMHKEKIQEKYKINY